VIDAAAAIRGRPAGVRHAYVTAGIENKGHPLYGLISSIPTLFHPPPPWKAGSPAKGFAEVVSW